MYITIPCYLEIFYAEEASTLGSKKRASLLMPPSARVSANRLRSCMEAAKADLSSTSSTFGGALEGQHHSVLCMLSGSASGGSSQ